MSVVGLFEFEDLTVNFGFKPWRQFSYMGIGIRCIFKPCPIGSAASQAFGQVVFLS